MLSLFVEVHKLNIICNIIIIIINAYAAIVQYVICILCTFLQHPEYFYILLLLTFFHAFYEQNKELKRTIKNNVDTTLIQQKIRMTICIRKKLITGAQDVCFDHFIAITPSELVFLLN